jgi:hypothetical protein
VQAPTISTAKALKDEVFPPIKYIVKGYLVEGATVLAGGQRSAKAGSRWIGLLRLLAVVFALAMSIARKAMSYTTIGSTPPGAFRRRDRRADRPRESRAACPKLGVIIATIQFTLERRLIFCYSKLRSPNMWKLCKKTTLNFQNSSSSLSHIPIRGVLFRLPF